MEKAPKSLRLHIGIFGRTNVGKSSFLNLVAGQDVAITSPQPGTTTDVVEKTMELLPIGPVVFLDTAGLDDNSVLADLRLEKTNKVFDRSDVILLITTPNNWGEYEEKIIFESEKRKIPFIIIINKSDLEESSQEFLGTLNKACNRVIKCSSLSIENRDFTVNILKQYIIDICPEDFIQPPPLIGDLLKPKDMVVMIIPIDFEAPKGRIILPQVQAIRDTLDADACSIIVKESEYVDTLNGLKNPPDLVVCDSQVVDRMVAETPDNVKCTTFSILFSRYRGDLIEAVKGAATIKNIKPNDKILIAESCSHHAMEDDIGREKIPRWFKKYVGGDLQFDVCAGRDYPTNLKEYKLIIHCGGCMTNRREMLSRIQKAKESGVPITNYGLCISYIKGVLERVLTPFPEALDVFKKMK